MIEEIILKELFFLFVNYFFFLHEQIYVKEFFEIDQNVKGPNIQNK